MVITLSLAELMQAAIVGTMRQVQNVKLKRHDRNGIDTLPDQAWQLHIVGSCGEAVVAKALDRFWSGNIGNIHAADVAGLEVRCSPYTTAHLVIYPGDKDDSAYVLVAGGPLEFTVPGWMFARDAKQPKYYGTLKAGLPPSWNVPQRELRPLDELPKPDRDVY